MADDAPPDCKCRLDWVLCFSTLCPRGKRISEQRRAHYERTMLVIGSPDKSTSGQTYDPLGILT